MKLFQLATAISNGARFFGPDFFVVCSYQKPRNCHLIIMESLQSFLQLAADLEGRLNANEDNAEITTIFENYLDAGIDQLEISSQMQIARNDRDIQTITIIENLLKYKKQPLGFTDKVLENAMVCYLKFFHNEFFLYLIF